MEWEGNEEWKIGMLLGIVGKLNERIIEAAKKFLVRMWNVRSLPFPMNGHERNNYEDHSYGSEE